MVLNNAETGIDVTVWIAVARRSSRPDKPKTCIMRKQSEEEVVLGPAKGLIERGTCLGSNRPLDHCIYTVQVVLLTTEPRSKHGVGRRRLHTAFARRVVRIQKYHWKTYL